MEIVCLVETDAISALPSMSVLPVSLLFSFKETLVKLLAVTDSLLLVLFVRDALVDARDALRI